MSTTTAKLRGKIRAPRVHSNDQQIEQSWQVIQNAVIEIQHKNASNLSFEALYRKAYNLVLRKHSDMLYNGVRQTLEDHLSNEVRTRLVALITDPDEKSFLKLINQLWDDHLLATRMISDVLMYLDRVYCRENHVPLIYDVGLNSFRDSVIKADDHQIGNHVINLIIDYLNKNRRGEIIDKFIIKAIISMMESLSEDLSGDNVHLGENYYLRSFEPLLMESSHQYYIEKATELISHQSGSLYIDNIQQLISDEETRFQLYLPNFTTPKLIELMDGDLISTNLENVLKLETDGLKTWVSDANLPLLSLVFKLVSRVDSSHEMLRRQMKNVVLQNGQDLMETTKAELEALRKNEEEQREVAASTETSAAPKRKITKKSPKENATQYAVKWVQNFLILKKKYDIIVSSPFEGNLGLSREVEAACAIFLNENNRVAEYLSLYIDDGIKRSFKDLSAEEIEEVMNNCIVLFRFVKDKDVFERYYKIHLGKRLLHQKSISSDLEMNMITKLKQEIGSSFTSKFEGMFKDMKLSQGLGNRFNREVISKNAHLKSLNHGRKMELDPQILTTNYWPMSSNKNMDDIIYPPQLRILKSKFEEFYATEHHGRNLAWAPTMGTLDLRMTYPKKTYEVNMPTLAAIIILSCFNDDSSKDEYTFTEIQELTQIPKPDLIRHLQSISVTQKTRLLKKTPMSREVNPDDVFSMNDGFKSPQTKIKVLSISSSTKAETDQQRTETMEIVNKSRVMETEAAIVRVMKARRILKHQELINDVIRLLSERFKPQPSFIKLRIENLIENEYLKRDDDKRDVYHYLA